MTEQMPETPLSLADPPAPSPEVVAAQARKAELMSDKAWGKRYLDGGEAERAEMSKVNAAIVGPPPEMQADPVVLADILSHVRDAGVSEDVVKQVETRMPISQAEHDAAVRWKTAHLKDPKFREAVLDNDYEARRKLTLANILIASPIKAA